MKYSILNDSDKNLQNPITCRFYAVIIISHASFNNACANITSKHVIIKLLLPGDN